MREADFYQRQMLLKEVGVAGQKKLKETSVLIVGAGGLGHPAAMYLAASGIGKITIVDDDLVEVTNLHRQTLFTSEHLGESKSKVLGHFVSCQNPFIHVDSQVLRVSEKNIRDLFKKHDLVLDCTDNFESKFMLHDAAYFYKRNLVQASIYQFEGQIQAFRFANKCSREKGCLRCLWPQIPKVNCVGNCATAGVVGAVAGVLGSLQAMEAIKMILGIGQSLDCTTVIFDLLTLGASRLSWKKSQSCPLCSEVAKIHECNIENYIQLEDFEVLELDERKYYFIDIREYAEGNKPASLTGTNYLRLPLSEKELWIPELIPQDDYLFICQKGVRSLQLVKDLRSKSILNCYSLYGGLDRYRG